MHPPDDLPYRYAYPRPALTCDVAVLTRALPRRVLLIRRRHDPFAGAFALPGGFVEEGETLEAAALRELAEETGVTGVPVELVTVAGDPGRDPRGWTVSVVYRAVVDESAVTVRAGDDAAEAAFFALDDLPELAFDHGEVLARVAAEETSPPRPPSPKRRGGGPRG